MILPFATIKYLVDFDGQEGHFLSVWLKGDSRRSADATARRNRRRVKRQDNAYLEWRSMERSERRTGRRRVPDPEGL